MKVGTDGVMLGAWATVNNCHTLLDIGTGCGVIALMLAQRTPDNVIIDAIDIEKKDVQQATENFQSSPWKKKLNAHHSSLQKFNPSHQYDCIVSNPPFFSNSLEPPDQRRKQVRHTDRLPFDDLLSASIKLLKPSGVLNLILPFKEGEQFTAMAKIKGLYCNRATSFRTRENKPVERMLLAFSFAHKPVASSEILLYTETNIPSKEYRSITEDFYINF